MSDDATKAAQRETALLAFKHINEVGEHLREQVLISLIESLPEAEAAKAERALFCLREYRNAQLELALGIEAYQQRSTGGKN